MIIYLRYILQNSAMFVCKRCVNATSVAPACSQLSPYLLHGAEARAGALATPLNQAPQQDTKCVCISLTTRAVQAQCQQERLSVSSAQRHTTS